MKGEALCPRPAGNLVPPHTPHPHYPGRRLAEITRMHVCMLHTKALCPRPAGNLVEERKACENLAVPLTDSGELTVGDAGDAEECWERGRGDGGNGRWEAANRAGATKALSLSLPLSLSHTQKKHKHTEDGNGRREARKRQTRESGANGGWETNEGMAARKGGD